MARDSNLRLVLLHYSALIEFLMAGFDLRSYKIKRIISCRRNVIFSSLPSIDAAFRKTKVAEGHICAVTQDCESRKLLSFHTTCEIFKKPRITFQDSHIIYKWLLSFNY